MQISPDLSPRTFGNEERLPRLPLPTLQESCQRFLTWCAPLLDGAELAVTGTAVAEFLAPGSRAHVLHAELERYDGQPGVASWLDDFWRHRYLGRRDRIALNANFFFLFERSPLGQVERAAALVAAAVAYKLSIDDERLAPAVLRGQPLSMEQNRYLFSSTRIPGDPQDTVRAPYSDGWPGPSQARHIVVFVRGHALALDVISPAGRPYTVDELAVGLRATLAVDARGPGVGQLTTKARAEWAASRHALLDAGNGPALDTIETALFCLALEDATPVDARYACDQLLHGDSANRWFDKGVSLIVFADGTAGFNGEHCMLDGTTIIGFLDAILTAPQKVPQAPSGGGETPALAPIGFALDATMLVDISRAGADFAAYAAATSTSTLSVDFSSERAKALRCSPDAFAQLALQLAHSRAKGHLGATYESIATRSFKHGRTEAMRVVTPEVVEFTRIMDDDGADPDARRSAFRAAADAHVARAKDCQAGRAPEQHLWELQRRGADLALYDSPGWRIMRDDHLSTSAVPSPHITYWGFGSTSQRCIGVGYAMMPGRFDLYLSTPRTVRDQMLAYAAHLREAVRELEELLTDAA